MILLPERLFECHASRSSIDSYTQRRPNQTLIIHQLSWNKKEKTESNLIDPVEPNLKTLPCRK